MPIEIHGKQYITVAERVAELHGSLKEEDKLHIETEVLTHNPVVIKATVQINENVFTGISAANPTKQIEKASPYEVAETSAVGRALGFAGFGAVDSIASAEEIVKANYAEMAFSTVVDNPVDNTGEVGDFERCLKCDGPTEIRISSSEKNPGREYHYCKLDKFSHWRN